MKDNDANALYERATKTGAGGILHIRVMGRSRDVELASLNLESTASDELILDAVCRFMELAPSALQDAVVERHESGNITVRPEAVFG